MKRILAAIGTISIGIVALAVAGVVYAFYEGNKLDREASAYGTDAAVAITAHWSADALRTRAAPALVDSLAKGQGERTFIWLSSLGPLQDRPDCQGNAMVYAGTGGGKTTANITCNAHYRAGPATLLFALSKKSGVWFILDFRVDSPVLLPQPPSQKA